MIINWFLWQDWHGQGLLYSVFHLYTIVAKYSNGVHILNREDMCDKSCHLITVLGIGNIRSNNYELKVLFENELLGDLKPKSSKSSPAKVQKFNAQSHQNKSGSNTSFSTNMYNINVSKQAAKNKSSNCNITRRKRVNNVSKQPSQARGS